MQTPPAADSDPFGCGPYFLILASGIVAVMTLAIAWFGIKNGRIGGAKQIYRKQDPSGFWFLIGLISLCSIPCIVIFLLGLVWLFQSLFMA